MGEDTIAGFLEALASGAPVPGGGAAAALEAAVGAALVSMVCNLTIGKEKYRAYEETMIAARAEAEELRGRALGLAQDDAASFSAVGAAYALPRSSDDEKTARQAAIQEALKGATAVPLRTMELAAEIVALCARIADGSNPNVISDVGVGALSARAALDGAALNVKINLALIKDAAFAAEAAGRMNRCLDETHAAADAVMRKVEESISR